MKRLILERQLKDHDGCVNCINFSSTGQLLSSGSDDLHVILWDWATGYKVAKFDSGHVANVFQVCGGERGEGTITGDVGMGGRDGRRLDVHMYCMFLGEIVSAVLPPSLFSGLRPSSCLTQATVSWSLQREMGRCGAKSSPLQAPSSRQREWPITVTPPIRCCLLGLCT